MGHVRNERSSSRNIAALFLSEKGEGIIIDRGLCRMYFFLRIQRILDKAVEIQKVCNGGMVFNDWKAGDFL